MAKAAKAPVAGQAGFDPFGGQSPVQNQAPEQASPVAIPKAIEQRETELAPAAMPPRVKPEITAEHVRTARVAKATELLAALVETGTNRQKLADAYAWVARNQEATAEQLFHGFLRVAEDFGFVPISAGTIRKAGQWLWGPAWEPESASVHSPSEETKKLRERVEEQEQQLAQKNSEMVSLRNQIVFLQDQVKRLGSENDYLKIGRNPSDFGAGHNALEMENALATA